MGQRVDAVGARKHGCPGIVFLWDGELKMKVKGVEKTAAGGVRGGVRRAVRRSPGRFIISTVSALYGCMARVYGARCAVSERLELRDGAPVSVLEALSRRCVCDPSRAAKGRLPTC